MSLIIYGASDDLVEVEGDITDEFDVYERTEFVVESPDGSALSVFADFGSREWEISVSAFSGGTYPAWPIQFMERPGYEGDPAVVIDAPVGTTIRRASDD